jgi:phage gp16-like protein
VQRQLSLGSEEDQVDTDSIKEAEANIAKMQSALADAQRMLAAAERAQEAAQRAHETAERHAAMLRTVAFVAIGAMVIGVFASFRRRHR